jgi:hypothetical protein
MHAEVVDLQLLEVIAKEIGSSIEPNNKVWCNRFKVQSTSSNREYVVAQRRSDGEWGCGCRGWINWRHCKHLTDMLGRLSKATFQRDSLAAKMLASARMAYLDLEDAKPVEHKPYTSHLSIEI